MTDRPFTIINSRSSKHAQTYHAPRAKDSLINRRMFVKSVIAAGAMLYLPKWENAYARRGRGAVSLPPGFLPAGHWVPAKMAMTAIYPLPNASVNSWARHLSLFFDPTYGSFDQLIPLGILGGAYPFVWQVITAPTAAQASVGTVYTASGYSFGGYGDLTLNPNAAFTSGTITVRGTGQDGNYLDLTFAPSTTNSVDVFPFANADSGSDSAAGTIDAPFQTLAKLVTFPGAIAVLRGATASYVAPTSGSPVALTSSATPQSFIGYPNETATIDITDGGGANFFGFGNTDSYDNFFQGFTFSGTSVTANSNESYRHIWQGSPAYRFVAHKILFPNVYSGTNDANNSTGIYFSFGGSGSTTNENLFIKGCYETGRTNPGGGHSYGIFCSYSTQNGIAEFNSIPNSAGSQNLFIKASNNSWSIRYNYVESGTGGILLGDNDQVNVEPVNGNNEFCYNFVINTDTANVAIGGFIFNENDQTVGSEWSYRNSYINMYVAVGASSGNGPFSFENDVIQWQPAGNTKNKAALYYYQSGSGMVDTLPLPPEITNTGTECQAATGVVDSTTYLLTGTYRTNYLGTRGAEIA